MIMNMLVHVYLCTYLLCTYVATFPRAAETPADTLDGCNPYMTYPSRA